ncbi:MAG: BrnA antitoxin family protein [Burkholderiales bacterium]
MPKITPRRVIRMPTPAENAKILAAAKSDPDAQPLTKRQLAAMVPLKSVRGRPKSETKKLLVSVRYSPEVIAYFRSTGDGWQGRMDGVLSEYVNKHAARRTRSAT